MQINWMEQIFTLVGGLAIFLYGMKMMSEGLQEAAGARLKRIFEVLTANRVMGVAVGVIVTGIIQSSSATTVMVVGFVNAGLMDLQQAGGIIMGANVGTTVTAWIITFKITRYAMPLVALGVGALMFSRNETARNIGRILFGLGLLFMGLKLMESAFAPLRDDKDFIMFFTQFGAENFGQIIKSVFAGCLLTVIIQSSSATVGITIALANQGLLTYPAAAALVLGENIGTTITALLACIGTNHTARRAAVFHSLFNVFGVIYMLAIFKGYLQFIDWLIPGAMDAVAADGTKPYIAAHIAAGHSVFNIANTIMFLPFMGLIVKAATFLVPGSKEKVEKHLEFIDYNFIATPAIALSQAKRELIKMFNMTLDMFRWMRDFHPGMETGKRQADRLFKYENIVDALQRETTLFLSKVLQSSPGAVNSDEARRYIRVADEVESIGDYCERAAKFLLKGEEQNLSFSPEAVNDLAAVHEEVSTYLELTLRCFIDEKPRYIHEADAGYDRIAALIRRVRASHIERLNVGGCEVVAGILYNDILTAYKGLASHALNVIETVAGKK